MERAERALDPAIVQQAARWMARLWSGQATLAEQAACSQWRAAHADHERAWSRLQYMEDKLHSLPAGAARQALRTPRTPAGRRRAMQLLGLTAVLGGAAYVLRETQAWPALAAADYRTGTGEIRTLLLPDGSSMVLGTATRVDLHFDGGQRLVLLHTGEILVTTAADTAGGHRSFVVQSRQGRVWALGTRFSVRQDVDDSRVAVFQGAVQVQPSQPGAVALRVEAGQATAFTAVRVQPAAVLPDIAAAWAQGLLVAENMRVDDFLAELGRYRSGWLRCDPAVADLRVTGVFSLRDTDRALDNLALGLPLELVYRTRYWVTVRARQAA